MIDKNCCYPNVFIQIFTMIKDTLKEAKKKVIILNKCEWNNKRVLLVGDKLMPEIHLKEPGFTYSVCGPFTKECKNLKK